MCNPADVQTPLERWGLEPSGSSMLLCLQLLCGCRVAGPCAKLQVPCMAAVHGATSGRAPSVEPMTLPKALFIVDTGASDSMNVSAEEVSGRKVTDTLAQPGSKRCKDWPHQEGQVYQDPATRIISFVALLRVTFGSRLSVISCNAP
ncbi:hypothetical protein ACP4OV_012667 [Aristida adscensionis]